MYYVLTKGLKLIGVTYDNAYELNIADASIHECEGTIPDLNTHVWNFETDEFILNQSRMTKLMFLNKLTLTERIQIRNSIDHIVIDIMDLFNSAEFISVEHPNTIQALHYLQLIGILTEQRLQEILET
jgi:hypothetical protein